jgi:hypothetical protein
MRLVPAQRPVETGEPVFADPDMSMLNWTFPYPHNGVATARVAHGCGSDLRLPEHEFCSADIPTRLAPVRPASGSACGQRPGLGLGVTNELVSSSENALVLAYVTEALR